MEFFALFANVTLDVAAPNESTVAFFFQVDPARLVTPPTAQSNYHLPKSYLFSINFFFQFQIIITK
jgi:hypothetical protein